MWRKPKVGIFAIVVGLLLAGAIVVVPPGVSAASPFRTTSSLYELVQGYAGLSGCRSFSVNGAHVGVCGQPTANGTAVTTTLDGRSVTTWIEPQGQDYVVHSAAGTTLVRKGDRILDPEVQYSFYVNSAGSGSNAGSYAACLYTWDSSAGVTLESEYEPQFHTYVYWSAEAINWNGPSFALIPPVCAPGAYLTGSWNYWFADGAGSSCAAPYCMMPVSGSATFTTHPEEITTATVTVGWGYVGIIPL
ncbi:MAG TPA: hypothetical protein HA326_03215 [Thermoplasmata archaeon]|nr:hypothetical protein [Thermoplasmata archaeon]